MNKDSHFTGFLCCLRHLHVLYADGQIVSGVFNTLTRKEKPKITIFFL